MKKKMLLAVGLVLVTSLLLAGCAQGLMPASWPGIVTDDDLADAAGIAYVAAGFQVYAVNLADGEELWRFPLKPANNKAFYAAPVLTSDGQLIIGGYDHVLYSLDPMTGETNWEFKEARDRYIGSVLVANDMIYAPNADYKLYALDLEGSLQWTFAAKQSLWAAPVIDGDTLYIGSLDRKVYALDAGDGKKIWERNVEDAVIGSLVTAEGSPLFVATFGGKLYALDKFKGEILWQESYDGRIWSGAILDGGQLFFADDAGVFHVVDAVNGQEIWNKNIESPILGLPLITLNTIVFGTEAGDLYAFSRDGEKLWDENFDTEKTEINLYGSPVLAGENFLIAPVGGENILVELDQTGAEIWAFTPAK